MPVVFAKFYSYLEIIFTEAIEVVFPSDAVSWATGRASACKKLGVGLLVVTRFDWRFARLMAPVVTTTSIIICFSKIHNGNILVLANPDPPGEMPVKMEREEGGSAIIVEQHQTLDPGQASVSRWQKRSQFTPSSAPQIQL